MSHTGISPNEIAHAVVTSLARRAKENLLAAAPTTAIVDADDGARFEVRSATQTLAVNVAASGRISVRFYGPFAEFYDDHDHGELYAGWDEGAAAWEIGCQIIKDAEGAQRYSDDSREQVIESLRESCQYPLTITTAMSNDGVRKMTATIWRGYSYNDVIRTWTVDDQNDRSIAATADRVAAVYAKGVADGERAGRRAMQRDLRQLLGV